MLNKASPARKSLCIFEISPADFLLFKEKAVSVGSLSSFWTHQHNYTVMERV